ncbi:hypothetical protein HWC53_gp137 [Bacillus phage vB_BmeM-Goe8]|uniref:Uncharacterized protein n=1 Tax=Bacillus phage vB_BmeM-Goe8 TaxID=2593638 RepID=A0A516KMY1_9CAUD|nr:hypothetical protein HWC53_gp137 [Bacillus phage vB_BmeM-Goe8]QDP42952.1 hypothetical protein Goe8_c01790 [Bacillus phage vB_BmeM-Goe8]
MKTAEQIYEEIVIAKADLKEATSLVDMIENKLGKGPEYKVACRIENKADLRVKQLLEKEYDDQ